MEWHFTFILTLIFKQYWKSNFSSTDCFWLFLSRVSKLYWQSQTPQHKIYWKVIHQNNCQRNSTILHFFNIQLAAAESHLLRNSMPMCPFFPLPSEPPAITATHSAALQFIHLVTSLFEGILEIHPSDYIFGYLCKPFPNPCSVFNQPFCEMATHLNECKALFHFRYVSDALK